MDAMAIFALLAALVVAMMNISMAAVFPGIRLLVVVFFLAASLLACSIIWILEGFSRKETAVLVARIFSDLKLCHSEKDILVKENSKLTSHVADLEVELKSLTDTSAKLKRAQEGNDKLIFASAGLKSRILALEADNMRLQGECEARSVEASSRLQLVEVEKSHLQGEKDLTIVELGTVKEALDEARKLALDLSLKLQQALEEKESVLARLVVPAPPPVLIPAVAKPPVFVDMPRHRPRGPRIGPKDWEKEGPLATKVLRKRYLKLVHEDARKKAAEREQNVLLEKLRRENEMCRFEAEMRGEDPSDFEEETLEEFERRHTLLMWL